MAKLLKSSLATQISDNFPDNDTAEISEADLRDHFTDQNDSYSTVDREINPQTGTTYTLVLTDAGNPVTMANAAANVLTIPTNASVAFPIGTQIDIWMYGAGTTTVDGDTGVTVNGVSGGGAAILARYAAVTILKIGTNEWLMAGLHGTVA